MYTNTESKIQSISETGKEYISHSLRFWASTGYDSEHGGYYEAVDFDGKPLSSLHRRFRIHPRNIFAHTAATVKGYGDYLDTAIHASNFILANCWQKKQGFATLSDNEGAIVDTTIMLYDQVFTLLAYAWLYHATLKKEYKHNFITIWDIINETLTLAHGGFAISNKALQKGNTSILQNPHMHLFEALLEAYRLLNEEYWLIEATKIYTLLKNCFYNAEHHVIIEHQNEDFSPQDAAINKIEPGHHFEWVWLLHKYRVLLQDAIDTDMVESIYQFAMKFGLSKQATPYEVIQCDGTPVKSTQRMWAQTEMIKAHLAMYEYSNDTLYLKRAIDSLETLYTYFCSHKIPGIWYDCYDIQGNMIAKNSPSSTLYHLFIAIDECIRVMV